MYSEHIGLRQSGRMPGSEKCSKLGRVEVIEYDGMSWHRYPDAPGRTDRLYFKHHTTYLHRYVWEKHNGPIPKGCHIHHIDGNPLNNDISNLRCVTPFEHAGEHPRTDEYRNHVSEQMRGDSPRQNACRAWHASEAGHEWHVEHGKRVAANMQPVQFTCIQCGRVYLSKPAGSPHKFCSNACKSAHRRASGVDDEDRICQVCGKAFRVNKYSKSRTCSRSCGRRLAKLNGNRLFHDSWGRLGREHRTLRIRLRPDGRRGP